MHRRGLSVVKTLDSLSLEMTRMQTIHYYLQMNLECSMHSMHVELYWPLRSRGAQLLPRPVLFVPTKS